MREIKFRAWSPYNQEMYYSDQDYENGGYRFHVSDDSVGYYPTHFVDELDHFCTNESEHEKLIHVMQFSGLLDKNGKKIYEGDVILFRSQNFEVVCRLGAFGIITSTGLQPFATIRQITIVEGKIKKIEVIGNIYENPELIAA